MGKKGPSRHLKRQSSPKFWPVSRKEDVWAIKTEPGAHRSKVAIPLLVAVRDFMDVAETAKEARMIIKQTKVFVDGKPRKSDRYPIGLMDVLELPTAQTRFRVLPRHGGRFILHPISKEETNFKLCKIIGKTIIKNGLTQLNLHDGRNVNLTDSQDPYQVNDTIKLTIPEQEIIDHIVFNAGIRAIITGGKSQGKYGIIIDLGTEPGNKKTATIRTQTNEDVKTLSKYVFAVGTDSPLISLPEVI
jgi:small subunit ribosomal protein S4e